MSVVETVQGKVEGRKEEGYLAFRGIPFASPPTGELRFRAPQPPASWSGVRPATEYAMAAPQRAPDAGLMAVGPTDEDCLYLNVDTPAADGRRRPVFVWIHGGGFTAGAGSQSMYRGGPLARRGDVVVVSINYRLGALGYVSLHSHGGTAIGATANAGQLDQIAALEWVRDNIAAFGGDPGNVTIAGESAGGMAVSALLAMPGAKGLFHRAAAQSGTAIRVNDANGAAKLAAALLAELGAADAEALRGVEAEQIVRAQFKATRAGGMGRGPAFAPIVDGSTLPQRPLDAVRKGYAAEIPFIVGTNRDEAKLWPAGGGETLDDEGLETQVRAMLGRSGDEAKRLIDTYRSSRSGRLPAENRDLLAAISTDLRFRIPGLRFADAQQAHQPLTYSYLFCWESPGLKSAVHGLEIPFVFGTYANKGVRGFAGTGPEADRLSGLMMDAWIGFMRDGSASHSELSWTSYTPGRRSTAVFDAETAVVDAPFDEERAAWDGIIS